MTHPLNVLQQPQLRKLMWGSARMCVMLVRTPEYSATQNGSGTWGPKLPALARILHGIDRPAHKPNRTVLDLLPRVTKIGALPASAGLLHPGALCMFLVAVGMLHREDGSG